jgi:hypothetical protein
MTEEEVLKSLGEMTEIEALEKGGSLVKGNPEDVGMGKYGNTPALKESQRALQESLRVLVDTGALKVSYAFVNEVMERIKKGELKEEKLKDIVGMLHKMNPPRTESHVEHEFTVGELVLKMHAQRKKAETIDVEASDG